MKKSNLILLMTVVLFQIANAEDIIVYSSRSSALLGPVVHKYEKETGVNVKLVEGTAGPLMEQLRAEGSDTPADVFITVDGGNLWQADQMRILRPIESKVLAENIPANLRDPNNKWFGLSVRARTIFYNPDLVKPSELSSYEDLADPKWKGKLCLRTSKSVYNQSLVATMIKNFGEKKTSAIVRGWVENLATNPFPNDNALLEAIGAGQCAVGLANTYYYGRLLDQNPKLNVKLFWADQNGLGTHVNISGAGVTRYSKHPKSAQKLIEWLSSDEAQNLFADLNHEFPANPKIKPDPRVAKWGSFKPNLINVSIAGKYQKRAVMLMKRAGYN